ncbi:MAG: hypothetical protein L0Y58_19225 [Verrucomicrobia subdivision 3 bacterium]|nr:hypothetical protein [Limisphaerales bacterium]
MNINTDPAAASASSSRDNPCYGNDPTVATLNVLADDERSYQLPYAQFLYAETTPNPALEKDSDAPPEKLVIAFAVANVTVLGSGLRYIERTIQKYELKFVKSATRRYAAALKTHVAAVTISFTSESHES